VFPHTLTNTHTNTSTYTHTHTHIHTHTHLHTHTHTLIIHAHSLLCEYLCTQKEHTHTYTYTYKYKYTHTRKDFSCTQSTGQVFMHTERTSGISKPANNASVHSMQLTYYISHIQCPLLYRQRTQKSRIYTQKSRIYTQKSPTCNFKRSINATCVLHQNIRYPVLSQ